MKSYLCFLLGVIITSCSVDEKEASSVKPPALKSYESSVEIDYSSYNSLDAARLDTALNHASQIKLLIVTLDGNYKKLCDNIHRFKNPESLLLFGDSTSNTEMLFDSLKSVTSLKDLFLHSFHPKLTGKLQEVKQLKDLTLKNSNITKVSLNFLNKMTLSSLEIIEEDNHFTFTGEIDRSNSLKVLGLYGYGDKKLSKQIFKLNNLETLIIGNSHLAIVPSEIKGMAKLNRLVIEYSVISKNKKSIENLRELLYGKCIVKTEEDIVPPF